jgi:hypothetical protein
MGRVSRRPVSPVVAAVAVALVGRLPAVGAEPVADTQYIAAGSEFHYVAVAAPLPVEQIGALAADGLAQARGAVAAGAPVATGLPPVEGSAPADLPPPGWEVGAVEALARMRTGPAPFDAGSPEAPCRCATSLGDTGRERVAALYAVRRFTVGPELGALRMLALRARVRDGLVARINGREVARRHIDPAGSAVAFAARPHGPEWETFHIPVVPGLLRAGDNLLAVEVRPSASRMAPALDLELAGRGGARLVRGPLVQRVGATSATIQFDSDLPVRARVEYGPGPQLGRVARSAGGALAVRHLVRLDGLEPGAAVHYRVAIGADATEVFRFHGAPARGDVVRIAVYGDVRGGHDVHGRLVAAMLRDAPDLVVATGDLVLRGTDEGDWQRLFEVIRPLAARVPYYPAVGNHDVGRSGDEERRMNETLALWPGPPDRPEWAHWYSFDVGSVHIAMLDSNAYGEPAQLRWLDADLAAARAAGTRAILAVTHDGPWSRGVHGGNARAAVEYVPVLERHGATILFSGHDHLYQRGKVGRLAYVVTGGGGAPLYPVRCGVRGRPRCARDGMERVASEHHYVLVTVYPDHAELCAKRPDGTPLEKCVTYRLNDG